MFCMKCGRTLSEGDIFCQSCGTKVWTKPEKAEPVEIIEEKPIVPEPEIAPIVEEAPIVPEPEFAPIVEEAPVEPVAAETKEDAFCTNCGAKLPEDSLFCLRCGEKIVPIAEEATVAPVATETKEDAFCTNCGAKLPEDSFFCLRCGEKVVPFEADSSVAEVYVADVKPEPQSDNFSYPEKVNTDVVTVPTDINETGKTKQKKHKSGSKGKKTALIIIAVVVALALIAGAIIFFPKFTFTCGDCGKRTLSWERHYINDPNGFTNWVCGDCYSSDPSNQEALQDGEAVDEATDDEVPAEDEVVPEEDVAPEDTPVTPEFEVYGDYTYSGETFTFDSAIYMGEFSEDHDYDMEYHFYEWKGDNVEIEVEIWGLPEDFDYMSNLEDWHGDEVYTDAWTHFMDGNMSEKWDEGEVIVYMTTDNYLYSFQIFSDDTDYLNQLYNDIWCVEYHE